MTRLGISHSLLKCSWPRGPPKKPHLQQEAREQRYQLLATECARLTIKHLLLAHQLNDQIGQFLMCCVHICSTVLCAHADLCLLSETFIHRLGRASGIDGLSGMKMVTHWQSNSPLVLVRPLLSFTRVCSVSTYYIQYTYCTSDCCGSCMPSCTCLLFIVFVCCAALCHLTKRLQDTSTSKCSHS